MDKVTRTQPTDRIVREAERRKITGISRSQWFRMEREGRAPQRRQIGDASVGWLESELIAWLRSLPAATQRAA